MAFLITTPAQLEAAYSIRQLVFVLEQKVDPAEEYDEYETTSRHFLALHPTSSQPAGTARWRKTENGIKLERFAVLEHARGLGLGRILLDTLLADIEQHHPSTMLRYLHAQEHAVPFYSKAGFITQGALFFEAGIPHFKMVLNLAG
jgi:predicted GNAT family N-acyltransferase